MINVAFIRNNGTAGSAQFRDAGPRAQALAFLAKRVAEGLHSNEAPIVLALVQDATTNRYQRFIVDEVTGHMAEVTWQA